MPLPEGFTITTPADPQINQAAAPQGFTIVPQKPTPEEQLNFAERFGQDLENRRNIADEIATAYGLGDQGMAESIAQLAGKYSAGLVMDFIGEGLVSTARGISAITPDVIEEPIKGGAISIGKAFLNTPTGQAGLKALSMGMDAYKEFSEKNPRSARNIESVVNIGALLIPAKAKAKPANITKAGKAAEKLEKTAVKQETAIRSDFVDDLVRAKETAAVKTEQVGRTTEEGILKQKVVELSPTEKIAAEAVKEIPEISKSKTLQGNYSVINKEIGKEADKLITMLEKSPVKISKGEITKSLNLAKTRLSETPTLVGDAGKTADRLINIAQKIIDKNPKTSAGLLRSRKQFDKFISSQKKDTVFDPVLENATSLAVREVRQTLNTLIDIKNPSKGVKDSLSKQAKLFSALDNIKPKAAAEGSNVVSRAWQNVSRLFPLKSEFNQSLATIFGIGGLGAAATFAPFFTKGLALGVGSYATGKFIMGPQAKKGLSMLLKQIDKGIRVAKDKEMIKQLRADRVAILELMKLAGENAKGQNNGG